MSSTRSMNILDAEARTGQITSPTVRNLNSVAGHFIVGITSLSSSQALKLHIYGQSTSGGAYQLFESLHMNQEAVYRFMLGPNVNCVAGVACRDFLPGNMYFVIEPSLPAQSDTYYLDLELSP